MTQPDEWYTNKELYQMVQELKGEEALKFLRKNKGGLEDGPTLRG